MSYTPKHAKPSSLKDATTSSHHGFGFTDAAAGRHARTNGKARRDTDADSPSTQAPRHRH
jgi:hypothetical protein